MQMEILKGREKKSSCTQEMHPTFCSIQFYNAIFTKPSNYYRNLPAGDQMLLKIW